MALLALGLRIWWIIRVGDVPPQGGDQEVYAGHMVTLANPSQIAHYNNFYFSPGYSIFGGLILWAQHAMGGDLPPRLIVGLVQSALSIGVMIMTAQLMRRRTGSSAGGLAAGAIMGFWISMITASGSLMPEHLSTPIAMLGMYLVLQDVNVSSKWPAHAGCVGALFGLTLLIKPAHMPMVLVAGLILAFRSDDWKQRARIAGAVWVTAALVVAPWGMHVFHQTGHIALSTAFGFNYCKGNNDDGNGGGFDEAGLGVCAQINGNDPSEDRELLLKGLRWAAQHPGKQPMLVRERWNVMFDREWANLSPTYYPGVWDSWTTGGSAAQWENRNQWEWTLIKRLAVVGFLRMLIGEHRRLALEMLSFAAAALIVPLLSVGEPRYRDVVAPLIVMWAAYTVVAILAAYQQRRSRGRVSHEADVTGVSTGSRPSTGPHTPIASTVDGVALYDLTAPTAS